MSRLEELKILLDKEEKSKNRSQTYIDDLKISIKHQETIPSILIIK